MRSARPWAALLGGVVVLLLAIPAMAQDRDTQVFEGIGSAGSDSPLEVYLLEGTYEHRIAADAACVLTAGVFPGERSPQVPLGDVLQADLALGGGGRAGPDGTFRVTADGWAGVQVGTGPDCRWTYSITGSFLPAGREPAAPGALRQPWILWIALGAAVAIVVAAGRRRRGVPAAPGDEDVRVTIVER